eukprot:COSAG02_NODE_835_length_16654_cov_52.747569_8_plen_174_part_00
MLPRYYSIPCASLRTRMHIAARTVRIAHVSGTEFALENCDPICPEKNSRDRLGRSQEIRLMPKHAQLRTVRGGTCRHAYYRRYGLTREIPQIRKSRRRKGKSRLARSTHAPDAGQLSRGTGSLTGEIPTEHAAATEGEITARSTLPYSSIEYSAMIPDECGSTAWSGARCGCS